jgi:hypothetical protein
VTYATNSKRATTMDGNSNQLIVALLLALGRHEIAITHEDWENSHGHELKVTKEGGGEGTKLEIREKERK